VAGEAGMAGMWGDSRTRENLDAFDDGVFLVKKRQKSKVKKNGEKEDEKKVHAKEPLFFL
jgi:hypothetical protein